MLLDVLLWGLVVGVIHFVVLGGLYGNPFIDRFYRNAQQNEPGVRRWPNKAGYMLRMFLGTQVEIYILVAAYLWLRPHVPGEGYMEALVFAVVFAGIRVYPRFWNMWIQSTYPNPLLLIEAINGTISTFVVVFATQMLV